MFKPIPGNRNFIISLNGVIRKTNGSLSGLQICGNNVAIELYGNSEIIDISWLALVAHFEIDLPKHYKSINFVDCNPVLIRSNSGKFTFFSKPIVVNKHYRVIPNYTKYAITKEGKILDIEQNQELLVNDSKLAYPSVHIYDPDRGHFKYVMIHRLVALAWVGNDDFVEKLIVNHIDGNKFNFHYSNLEWVSYSRNIIHANETGLRGELKKYKVRNISTGEIKEYDSFKHFCTDVGLGTDVKFKLRSYKTKVKLYKDKYEVKEIEDTSPWFYEHNTFARKNKYTITVYFPDGTKEIYPAVSDLIPKLKIWNSGGNISKLIRAAKLKYPGIRFDVVENISTIPVQALNIETMEVIESKTIRNLSLLLNISFSTIQKAVNCPKPYICNGFVFRFKTDLPWEAHYEKHPKASKTIIITNALTKETKTFSSLQDVADNLKASREIVKNRLVNKMTLNGWFLEEL